MVKKFILLCSATAILSGAAHAQHTCVTDEVQRDLLKQYPEIAQFEQELEREIQQKLSGMNLSQFAKTTFGVFDTVYHVPIVFHIVHNYNTGGNIDYISDDLVYETVKQINRMYNKQNPDTSDVIAPFAGNIPGTNVRYIGKANIVFHLATKDPHGNPTHGITRRRNYASESAGDHAKFDQWPPDSYLNIWIISRFDAGHSGAAAYAYKPASAAAYPLMYLDGVISLGSYTNEDNTLSHEIGHSLNLDHPWGGTNQPKVACGDDNVDDTPPTRGHDPSGACNDLGDIYDTLCAQGYFKTYTPSQALLYFGDSTATYIDYPDTTNAQNVMDYTYCSKMFTHLQTYRMRASLTSTVANRANLISTNNLKTTGILNQDGSFAAWPDLPPIADFSLNKLSTNLTEKIPADKVYGCANGAIGFTFTDRSWNDTIASRSWTFSNGASIPTSTAASVTNTFTEPGWVNVSLTVTGNGGSGSNTISRNAIYVADPNPTNAAGYYQEFNQDVDKWPIFNYFNNDWKWEVVNNVGYYDNTCIKYNGWDNRAGIPAILTGSPRGDYDDFFSPVFDLTGSEFSTTCNLNFATSGAFRANIAGDLTDSLEVFYSNNCGNSWNLLGVVAKAKLGNKGTYSTGPYTPLWMGDWTLQSIPITGAAKTANTMFRFRYRPGVMVASGSLMGSGNNFYLDRINISPWPAGVDKDVLENTGLALVPNPTHDGAHLIIKDGKGTGSVIVTDIAGKVVYRTEVQFNGTLTKVEIPAPAIATKGMYMVQLVSEGNTRTEKLVVY